MLGTCSIPTSDRQLNNNITVVQTYQTEMSASACLYSVQAVGAGSGISLWESVGTRPRDGATVVYPEIPLTMRWKMVPS